MKRVLLVSHNFPPTAGPESLLVRLNAEFLHRAGWEVRVLTTTSAHTNQSADETLLDGLPEEIIVDRVASPEGVLAAAYPRIGKRLVVFAGRNVLPEVYLPWFLPAMKRAEEIVAEWKPSVLYSRATKHVSNVVGWRLKRKTGLPWVAHFSDLWISSGLYKSPLQRLLGWPLEKRILRDADALVFVTEQAAERALRNHPSSWRKRAHIIPHGYAPLPDSLGSPGNNAAGRRALKMVHAGAFYQAMREPDTLIEALRRLHEQTPLDGRLELSCFGADTVAYQHQIDAAGLGRIVRLEPALPFETCQKRIANSDLILVIDSAGFEGIFLPTKLIEGFAYQKPVLGLAEPNSAVARTLQSVGQAGADLNQPDQIAERIAGLLGDWEDGRWGLSPEQSTLLKGFELDRVNLPLAEILDRLSGA